MVQHKTINKNLNAASISACTGQIPNNNKIDPKEWIHTYCFLLLFSAPYSMERLNPLKEKLCQIHSWESHEHLNQQEGKYHLC